MNQDLDYFKVTVCDDECQVEGCLKFDSGYKIPRPDIGNGIFDGAWFEWCWNAASQSFVVRTSPHGLVPLYYVNRKNLFIISPSIESLLNAGASPEWNWTGLAVMLRLGYFVDNDTPFKEIIVAPPNATMTWRAGHFDIQELPSFVAHDQISRKQAIEKYLALVDAAVQRRLPQTNYLMPLSGGRDSRHILLALIDAKCIPELIVVSGHYSGSASADVDISQAIAARLGVPHEVVQPPKSEVFSEIRKNLQTEFCVADHGWTLAIAEKLNKNAVIYDGFNAGVLFGRGSKMAQRSYLAIEKQYENLAMDLLDSDEAALRAILTGDAYTKLSSDIANDRLLDVFQKYDFAANPYQSFLYWNRARRSTAYNPFKIISGPMVYCPFDDLSIVDFALSLPIELSTDATLQSDAIRLKYPQFADIPFHNEQPVASYYPAVRACSKDFLLFALSEPSSNIVRFPWVIGNSLLSLLGGQQKRLMWWIYKGLYLLQLERFSHKFRDY